MTRDEPTDRVIELFPPLAEVNPGTGARPTRASRWWWSRGARASPASTAAPWTDHADPEHVEGRVWRIEPSGHYALMGLMDDPLVTAAAEQAPNN